MTNPQIFEKGQPCVDGTLSGTSLLKEEVSLPAAVLRQDLLLNNIRWMQEFADAYQTELCPHGKTTMSPWLFQQQLNAGAWGITLATVQQVSAAAHHGINRILMANQLVGLSNMKMIASVVDQIDFYCVVDSVDNVHQLGEFFTRQNKTLKVLIEIGCDHGRCGVRAPEQVVSLAQEVNRYPCLELAGVEFYEGVIHGESAESLINQFIDQVIIITEELADQNLFSARQIILTGAGSAWYDIVADHFSAAKTAFQRKGYSFTTLLRPGCYITHDTGIYQDAQQALLKRNAVAKKIKGDLQSCLEVWGYVQSIPEPGLAVIGIGKRDIAYDAGLPLLQHHYRPGENSKKETNSSWKTTAIMDQHLFLNIPPDSDIRVGDMLGFSCSHPCLTFDKWRNLLVVDEQYRIQNIINTCF